MAPWIKENSCHQSLEFDIFDLLLCKKVGKVYKEMKEIWKDLSYQIFWVIEVWVIEIQLLSLIDLELMLNESTSLLIKLKLYQFGTSWQDNNLKLNSLTCYICDSTVLNIVKFF